MKYIATINGNKYDIDIDMISERPIAAGEQSVQPAPKAQPIQEAPKAAPVSTGSTTVKAPMPGTILEIKVAIGQQIKKNQVVCILEAMKMENEIVAPQDGTISSVNVQKGASVNTGDALVMIG